MRLSVRFGSGEFSDSEPGEFAVPDDEIPLARAQRLDDAPAKERNSALRHDYYYILAYT